MSHDPRTARRSPRLLPSGARAFLTIVLGPVLGVAAAGGLAAQIPDTVPGAQARPFPADTWSSPSVRALMQRALLARDRVVEGLESWEGRMWERTYVGLSAGVFRRERGLLEQEREARVRWSRDGERVVRWERARRDVPIVGSSSAGDPTGAAEELAKDLAEPRLPPPLAYDPGSSRLSFGGSGGWALSPLADTAGHHYRYVEGDTLTVTLPDGQRIVLAEVRVEPRRNDSRLVAGSLWFDQASARLVRAGYRPARPFDLEMDQPDDAGDVPGFLLPIRAEIRYVTIDHGLYEMEWWIPRRFAFEGEAQLGRLARFPVRFEWTVDDLSANPDPSPATDPDLPLPEGWTLVREEVERSEGEPPVAVAVMVPPAEALAADPPFETRPGGPSVAFAPEELEALEDALRGLLPRGQGAGSPLRWSRGLQDGLTRYNRVEGLSTGLAAEAAIAPDLRARGEIRLGIADLEPGVEVALLRTRGRSEDALRAYRRLAPSADWGRPLTLGASTTTLLFGSEHDPFHRAAGLEVVRGADGTRVRSTLRLFGELHRTARRGTHVHLGRLIDDRTLPDNPPADRGWYAGASARLQWQSGVDARRPQLLAEAAAEAAGGTGGYGRAWGSAGLRLPLVPGWSAALEAGGGSTAGRVPAQRQFFPGGSRIYRGLRIGERSAEAFWFGRAELARGPVGARLSGFVDVLGAGERDRVFSVDPEVAVGLGASLLDGLLRLDLVRSLGDEGRLRLVGYLDGLL